jgi:hypothetical protein
MDDEDDFGFDFSEDMEEDFDIDASDIVIDTPTSVYADDSNDIDTSYDLMHRFMGKGKVDTSFQVSNNNGWTKRGTIKIFKSQVGEIKKIEISNDNAKQMDEITQTFEKHCQDGDKYQLGIKELDLITAISSCAYIENDLYDALIFILSPSGEISSFAYQKSYTKYKKAPKKWITEGLARKIEEGPRPQFKFKNYDLTGKEKLDKKQVKKQEEEDQPWYSKYWWALLLGGVLFMQVLAPAAAEEEGQGGNGAPAARPVAK